MVEAMDVDTAQAYAKAKRSFVLAAVGIGLGLAVAGTLERTAGGVVIIAALALLAGLQLVLAFLAYDMATPARRPLQRRLPASAAPRAPPPTRSSDR